MMGKSSYENKRKKRPYWHVDAKWICGIIFLVFFITGILFFNISQIISKNNIIDTAGGNIETSIKNEVSTFFDTTGKPITQNKETILAALSIAGNKISDLAGNANTSAKENETSFLDKFTHINNGGSSSPFRQIINYFTNTKNYAKDVEEFGLNKLEAVVYSRLSTALNNASAKLSSVDLNGNVKDEVLSQINIPKVYSEKQYTRYRNDAIVFLSLALVFLIAAIYFSSGFGRASTPGFLLLMSSLPGFFILASFDGFLKQSPVNNFSNSDSKIVRMISSAILDAFKSQASSLFSVYKYLFFIALTLLIVGILGSIIMKLFGPKPTTHITPQVK